MNERTLVSLRTISALEPIDGADFIEKAFVDGWTVVVKKGEYALFPRLLLSVFRTWAGLYFLLGGLMTSMK